MRFINPNKRSSGSSAVSTLSETVRFVSGGYAKGNATECFSWVADFLFKSPENVKINPHKGYISFFSDKEIMYEEFGNVNRINDNYSFFSSVLRQKLPPDYFEFTRKQYTSVSNKKSDFDTIEYVNYSDQKKFAWSANPPENIVYTINYWRAPNFLANGYKLHLDAAENNAVQNFDKYYWAYPWSITSILKLKNSIVEVPRFLLDIILNDYMTNDLTGYYMSHTIGEDNPNVRKIIDSKIDISNAKYFYFENNSEWVCYYNDTTHYYEQSYSPYYGIVNYYHTGESWVSMSPQEMQSTDYPVTIFFPSIIRNNVLEPAKIVTRWVNLNTTNYDPIITSGQMVFNNGIHLGQPNDQSRLVYNACKHMITNSGFLQKTDIDGMKLYWGIDVDTERNRRYSSVVMTEPYFVTTPICGGEIVSYNFVDMNNKPIKGSIDFGYKHITGKSPDMFLKIKTTKYVIDELDRLLNQKEYNTDIIETVSINNPTDTSIREKFCNRSYYENFNNILGRQEDCCDDLIGDETNRGIVGEGHHTVFTLPGSVEKYSSMRGSVTKKINGFGFVSKTVVNELGIITDTTNVLNIYCSNYVPKNSPGEDPNITIDNVVVPFLNDEDDQVIISNVTENELFRPMIKIPGINGYIKIMERNVHFKITRSNDGLYEVVYNVEFPFCPGSYNERLSMDFTEDNPLYKETVILKKLSYISAGSWKNNPDNRYDVSNDRYVPFADDSFCAHNVLLNGLSTDFLEIDDPKFIKNTISTNSFKHGGGTRELLSSEKNVVHYPEDLVWFTGTYDILAMLKPRHESYKRFGTYELGFNLATNFQRDVKIFALVDNRQWNFDDDKYISYIGKENPNYVCEIDLSTLFKNFTDLQSLHAGLPDLKRWLYAYFSGFANTALNYDSTVLDTTSGNENHIVTEKVNTFGNVDIPTVDSESDMVIEMWDSTLSNWRPMSFVSNNSQKLKGKLILDGINISDYSEDIEDGLVHLFDTDNYKVYTATISYINENGVFRFPEFVNYLKEDDIISGKSNLVLYDNVNQKTYHIIYVEPFSGTSGLDRQMYRIYIYYDPADGVLPKIDPENYDINNRGSLAIYEAKKQINKDVSFDIYTESVVQEIEGNIIRRFFDIRSVYTTTPAPVKNDAERYVDDNKMYFRIRVVKKKNYSVSFESDDESIIQYNGIDITSPTDREWMNFPWTSDNGNTFDQEFDWKKISNSEILRKFGMSYFKCASR